MAAEYAKYDERLRKIATQLSNEEANVKKLPNNSPGQELMVEAYWVSIIDFNHDFRNKLMASLEAFKGCGDAYHIAIAKAEEYAITKTGSSL